MGYKPRETYARIIGEDDLEGMLALVKIRPISRGYYQEMLTKPDEAIYEQFVNEVVREWNLEDDDGPIPASSEHLNRVDRTTLSAIIGGWFQALNAPPLAPNVRHELGSTLT